MTEIYSSCEGCRSSYYCDLVMNGTTKGCPCKVCIVKMTCSDNCELFEKTYEKRFGFKPASGKGW